MYRFIGLLCELHNIWKFVNQLLIERFVFHLLSSSGCEKPTSSLLRVCMHLYSSYSIRNTICHKYNTMISQYNIIDNNDHIVPTLNWERFNPCEERTKSAYTNPVIEVVSILYNSPYKFYSKVNDSH